MSPTRCAKLSQFENAFWKRTAWWKSHLLFCVFSPLFYAQQLHAASYCSAWAELQKVQQIVLKISLNWFKMHHTHEITQMFWQCHWRTFFRHKAMNLFYFACQTDPLCCFNGTKPSCFCPGGAEALLLWKGKILPHILANRSPKARGKSHRASSAVTAVLGGLERFRKHGEGLLTIISLWS